jgi:methionyl-tRNA synthetase
VLETNTLEEEKFAHAYNILCQSIPMHKALGTPGGSALCRIKPRGLTAAHEHHDQEVFIITKGMGEMRIGPNSSPVTVNSVISIPPYTEHELKNLSEDEDLEFISFYWDTGLYPYKVDQKPTLIHSAPPTPNGKLHLGHLSGPYLSSDVYRRALKWQQDDVFYVCGSDDHQSYVKTQSEKENTDPNELRSRYRTIITNILEKYRASPDYFLNPQNNQVYEKTVQSFFTQLYTTGKIYRTEKLASFCKPCNIFIHEAFVSGDCPHCFEKTNANGCENCGFPTAGAQLLKPTCNKCHSPAITRSYTGYFFPIENYKKQLRSYYENLSLPPRIKNYLEQLLLKSHEPVAVAFVSDWGIKVPDESDLVIYEWLEMAAGYLFESKQIDKSNFSFYKSATSRTIWSFGFDNSYFYLALVPALLLAFDTDTVLPEGFLINEFYLLDEKKFSTSRNHAIWGDEILESVAADPIRLYIAKTRAESSQSNFSAAESVRYLENEWLEKGETFFAELMRLLDSHKSEKFNPWQGPSYLSNFYRYFQVRAKEATFYYQVNNFSTKKVIKIIEELKAELKDYSNLIPQLNDQEKNQALTFIQYGLKVIFILLEPISPVWANLWLKELLQNQPRNVERLFEIDYFKTDSSNVNLTYLAESVQSLKTYYQENL